MGGTTSSYVGKMKNSKKHGLGTFNNCGNVYCGEWIDDQLVRGKIIYKNGDIYQGEWDNSRFVRGKITYKNGDVREGEWVGKATYTTRDGLFKTGTWNGPLLIEGVGRGLYQGYIYDGNWEIGLPHGDGTWKGQSLKWSAGKWTGYVSAPFDGGLYTGFWIDSVPHGEGSVTQGSIFKYTYSGSWNHGTFTGKRRRVISKEILYGDILFMHGDVYDGEWKDDVPHGNGTFTHQGYKLIGNWNMGLFTGKGKHLIITYEESGRGRYIKHTSHYGTFKTVFYEGTWENGKFQGPIMQTDQWSRYAESSD